MIAATPDASLAIRHFPMCKACNPHALDLHPNACWAARAAEAASIVGGDAAFWRMHRVALRTPRRVHGRRARRRTSGARLRPHRLSSPPCTPTKRSSRVKRGHRARDARRARDDADDLRERRRAARLHGAERARTRAGGSPRARSGAAPADQPLSARERFLALWRNAPITAMPRRCEGTRARPHGRAGECRRVRRLSGAIHLRGRRALAFDRARESARVVFVPQLSDQQGLQLHDGEGHPSARVPGRARRRSGRHPAGRGRLLGRCTIGS